MTQIIPAARRGKSFMDSLLGGAAEGLNPAIQQYFKQKQLQEMAQEEQRNVQGEQSFKKEMAREQQAADLQRGLAVEQLKQGAAQQKAQAEDFVDEESTKQIEKAFGPQFAKIWKNAPMGGKTELIKQGLDAKLRGIDINAMLKDSGFESTEQPQNEVTQAKKPPQMKDGKIPDDYQWPDFTKAPEGYTPKDWREERKSWRSENSPVFLENKTRLSNDKKDALSIKRLKAINSKLPSGLARIIINPSTGEPYGLAQLTGKVPPAVQEFEKIRAQFQNRAKDAFGSRVTNFDLVSYMKQFPTLLNTEEGRSRIIDMIRINNDLDSLYNDALDKVYKKYSLNGIPMEKADELAKSLIEDKTEELNNEYMQIDDRNHMEEDTSPSGRMVDVMGPDGQMYEVDEREAEQLPQGFVIQ